MKENALENLLKLQTCFWGSLMRIHRYLYQGRLFEGHSEVVKRSFEGETVKKRLDALKIGLLCIFGVVESESKVG